MEKLIKNTGIDEELKKGLEATSQASVEKLEAGLKEKQEQAFSGAEKKKEEIWQQIKNEVKRVEEGVGGTRGTEEEVAEAKQGGEDLKNKGSEADGELKSTLDIVMGEYKAEKPTEKERGAIEEELGNYLSVMIKEWELPDDDSSVVELKRAIETKDYEVLLDQIELCIRSARYNLRQVNAGDAHTIEYIKERRSSGGEKPDIYLQKNLENLRRFEKYLEDAKKETEILNTKTEEAAEEVEVEVKATEQKLKPTDTVTYEDILEKRAEEANQAPEVEQKVGVEKPKEGVVEEAVGKGAEGEKLRKELDEARKALALVKEADPGHIEVLRDYQAKKEAMQNVAYEAKKATLLKKGLSETDVEKELDKYTREVLAPNFTVAEAAKIQALRSEANPSLLEKMKDNKFSKLAYGAVDAYRKADWKKKIALSVGLLGVGVAVGATGGTAGLALAGIVTGGKGIQRFLSGAGTAVATEALIQRSQQKWMEKEGWGKNRHEYIAKQIASLRESAKKGGVLSEAEVEKSLSEREKMEKSNEINRAVLAGITGALVGSGAAWQAVKQVGEWTGASGVLGTAKDYWFGKAGAPLGQKDIAWKGVEEATPLPEEPVSLEIGARGPEGALIDNFRDNPDVAKAFGWDGKSDLSEWAGAKAGELWNADAKEALKNPQILAQMEKLGFSKDAEGYAKMAHRIGKGVIQIDPTGKNIKFADMEYLKNVTKAAKTFVDQPMPKAPSAEIDEYYAQRIAEQERLDGIKNAEMAEKSEYFDQKIAEQERLKDIARATKAETVENVQPKVSAEPLPTEKPFIQETASVEQAPKTGLGAEVKAPAVEHVPEVKVENIVTKTEEAGGNIVETAGVTAEIKGSTGQEFLSKDYMLKLKPSVAGTQFARTEAMMTSRGITARLGAYHELLNAGKTEEAAKHLDALRNSLDMADKSLGAGVIDRSKIPELK